MKGLFQCPPWARSFWAFSPFLNRMLNLSQLIVENSVTSTALFKYFILQLQPLHSATSSASFSQRNCLFHPAKSNPSPSEVESITQRSRIFHPAKLNPSPSEVVSVTSMKRMNLCNDVHDSICLLPKPNSLKVFFLQINATSATSHLNPLIINE